MCALVETRIVHDKYWLEPEPACACGYKRLHSPCASLHRGVFDSGLEPINERAVAPACVLSVALPGFTRTSYLNGIGAGQAPRGKTTPVPVGRIGLRSCDRGYHSFNGSRIGVAIVGFCRRSVDLGFLGCRLQTTIHRLSAVDLR
jgi:hypothetical protein